MKTEERLRKSSTEYSDIKIFNLIVRATMFLIKTLCFFCDIHRIFKLII